MEDIEIKYVFSNPVVHMQLQVLKAYCRVAKFVPMKYGTKGLKNLNEAFIEKRDGLQVLDLQVRYTRL